MANKKTVKRTVKVLTKPPTNSSKSKKAPTGKKTPSAAEKELLKVIPELSSDEVKWLLTQAKTMLHNHKVDEINKAAVNLMEEKKKAVRKKLGATASESNGSDVDIVQAGTKSFNILLANARLFINLEELKALVKIAQAADSADDGSGRLYRWMDRERRDMIIDGGISGAADPNLAAIYSQLREKFTVG